MATEGEIRVNAGNGMNKLVSWESLTGTKPTIESDRTVATVSFPLKSALQQNDADVPVNVPVKSFSKEGLQLYKTSATTWKSCSRSFLGVLLLG